MMPFTITTDNFFSGQKISDITDKQYGAELPVRQT